MKEIMDMYGFYTGKIFNAYQYLGAHLSAKGAVFRVFAPNATKDCIIGDFSNWSEIDMKKVYDGDMKKVYDGNFYECLIAEAKEGMKYKIRIYGKNGRFIDHADPYGYGAELRPGCCSIIRNINKYEFHDEKWMKGRTNGEDKPINIYEVHLGSWRKKQFKEDDWYAYHELADLLIPYVKENGYNYIEIMPICEYPCDESWGYQAHGFFSPTSRYGDMDSLKKLIDKCHQNEIGVILDVAPVHFAVNDFGLAEFDGTPLYEYPYKDIAYNEWGSKNFAHSRGEVRSFLQSAMMYWLKEYHFDGIRMDAISNIIYWQGNKERGVNQGAIKFIQYMNQGIKQEYPDVMLIAEDSTAYPKVTKSVEEGGLGFDYKWDMGWMNDTLSYFKLHPYNRSENYHKLTFSMMYFYSERFLMPFSHDEVVHGKATILQKMYGDYEEKFQQARTLYMYMYAHPGKKLNFMGNEIGQFREWDEKREQDWNLLDYPKHHAFQQFMAKLNMIYLKYPAFYEKDYEREGFEWIDCTKGNYATYAFMRQTKGQKILAVFNFTDVDVPEYELQIPKSEKMTLLLDSNWECFGGYKKKAEDSQNIKESKVSLYMERYSAKYYMIDSKKKNNIMSGKKRRGRRRKNGK